MVYEIESVQRAIKKYYTKNQDKIKEYSRQYSHSKYHNDPEYREQRKLYNKERYHLLKQKRAVESNGL